MRHTILLVGVILLLMGLLLACEGPSQQDQQQPQQSQALLEDRCTRCHTLDRITSASKTQEEWTSTVDRMIGKGATLDQPERESLIGYLAETYGS